MKNTVEYNNKAILELQAAMKKTKNIRMYKRYSVVLKHFQGFQNKVIAEMEGLEEHAVGSYIKKYKVNGLEGLAMKKPSGAPRKLSPEQEQELIYVITNNTPDEVGFEAIKNWTIKLICQWVMLNFKIIIKHSSMAVILHRLNLSYTRPTYVLKKADKEKQEVFKRDFETLKKTLDGLVDTILFQDESMIRDYQAIQKTWFVKGQQRKIPTYGKNAGVKLIGILDYETGHVYCEEHDKYDAVVFLEFLKKVLSQYPKGKIVIVLDNARIHHAKLIQPFLEEMKDRLELMFLPPYSPELNLIEGLWGWLKSSVVNNVFFKSVNRVKDSIQNFIRTINKVPTATIDRLCVRM
ncbi:IS630 family transposase [Clostridium manihotivorum]|uniref:IS630 family transposase n=1 Tax=Clostridium manihotivorum TaxID=2320868 RepID=A0A410E1U5_9CLOT|nr:IS630 family transposase [Clostridium manihotivorum]QAA35314.1 IS630 family transposase [Clostridium manihotivorum]